MPTAANYVDLLPEEEINSLVEHASNRLNQGSTAKPDYFLKIDSITGESTDSKHSAEIEVLAYQLRASQTGTFDSGTGGGTAGRAAWHPFLFVAKTSKASPKMMLACANGQGLSSAVLTCRKAGKTPQEYLVVTMSNVVVYHYSLRDPGFTTPPTPMDVVALTFSKIQQQYTPQNADGSLGSPVTTGYDLAANKPV
jgi:type VI secretion system secreted protein Hcp